jgi:ATP/maltotriose-dependent transcriptional regulator MalT
MPTQLRRQSPPLFDTSSSTVQRPALALVRRHPDATEQARESEQPPSALLALRLASCAQAAAVALSSALDDSALAVALRGWLIQSLLLEAITLAGHADLIAEIFKLPAAKNPVLPDSAATTLREPLTESEVRVLRYLPTDLSTREIGDELYLSVHTIKTHVKHLYAKLDAHSRREAVRRARALGLLSHSSRNR